MYHERFPQQSCLGGCGSRLIRQEGKEWLRTRSYQSQCVKGGQKPAETHVLEKAQHFVVCRVIWDEESQVGIVQYSSNADQTSTSTWHNTNILPCILTVFTRSVVHIIQVGHCGSQRLDTCGRTILAAGHCDINVVRALKRALYIIVHLRGALAQVGPQLWLLSEAMLVGALSTPDDAGRGTSRVEPSMGFVAFVGISELSVDLGVCLCVGCQEVSAFIKNKKGGVMEWRGKHEMPRA